jgi:tetratricopeptide (TPR) repeat protein
VPLCCVRLRGGCRDREQSASANSAGFPSTTAEIEALSATERNTLAAQLKDKGNKLYSKKEFQKAVDVYTRAIEISAKKDAVFYSNRAACKLGVSSVTAVDRVGVCRVRPNKD